MSDPLSSNTQEQMQALCRKISVAHDLDPEIQKELYGHMEDKLLAYRNLRSLRLRHLPANHVPPP